MASAATLRLVIPALARRGHEIAFWHELGERPDGDPFALPAGSPSWSVEQMGVDRALAGLGAWRPDLLFSHGLLDPEVEAQNTADRTGSRSSRTPTTARASAARRCSRIRRTCRARARSAGRVWRTTIRGVAAGESDHDGAGVSPAVGAPASCCLTIQGDRDAVRVTCSGSTRVMASKRRGQGAVEPACPPPATVADRQAGSTSGSLLFVGRMDREGWRLPARRAAARRERPRPDAQRDVRRRRTGARVLAGGRRDGWRHVSRDFASSSPAGSTRPGSMRSSPPPICSSCPASGPSHSGSSASRPRAIGCPLRRSRSEAYRTGFVRGQRLPCAWQPTDAWRACRRHHRVPRRIQRRTPAFATARASIAAEFDFEQHMDALMRVLNDVALSAVDVSRTVRAGGRP